MPEAPEPVNKEKFLAVNTPPVPQANASSGQAAVSALPDSPKAGDSVSVVLSARQKRAPITGSVAIRGLKKQAGQHTRSEEHTSALQSLMRSSYAVFGLKKKKQAVN